MSNPSVQMIRGIPFSTSPWCKKERVEETLDYTPRDGDIVIASYPKTGSTLLQYIVQQIVSKAEVLPSFGDMNTRTIPFIEMIGTEAIERMEPPRIYRHHFPYDMVRKNGNSKYLYTHRNPADALVSFFHFMTEMKADMMDFDRNFEHYMSGEVAYGRILEHVRSYWRHKDDANMLLVSYEKLLGDRENQILRIAEFLGEEHLRNLSEGGLLEKIVERTGFGYMKENVRFTHPIRSPTETFDMCPGLPPKEINFFRKGATGEGKKTLSQDQMRRLKEAANEVLEGTELVQEWFKE